MRVSDFVRCNKFEHRDMFAHVCIFQLKRKPKFEQVRTNPCVRDSLATSHKVNTDFGQLSKKLSQQWGMQMHEHKIVKQILELLIGVLAGKKQSRCQKNLNCVKLQKFLNDCQQNSEKTQNKKQKNAKQNMQKHALRKTRRKKRCLPCFCTVYSAV